MYQSTRESTRERERERERVRQKEKAERTGERLGSSTPLHIFEKKKTKRTLRKIVLITQTIRLMLLCFD